MTPRLDFTVALGSIGRHGGRVSKGRRQVLASVRIVRVSDLARESGGGGGLGAKREIERRGGTMRKAECDCTGAGAGAGVFRSCL